MMELQELIKFLGDPRNNYLNLEQKIGSKKMVNQEECIVLTLDLRPQC